MDMRIEQLQYFAEVVRTGSFSSASKNLFVSQQGISDSIKNLENEVEFPLLTRNNRGVSLTKNGECFYEKVVAFLNSYEDVLTCATELKRNYLRSSNKIILTVNPLFFKVFIEQLAPCPFAIELSIYETSIEESISYLQKGRIQLSIILVMDKDIALFKQLLPPELEALSLFKDKPVAIVSKHSIYADSPVIDGQNPSSLYVDFTSSYYSYFNMNKSNITSVMTSDIGTQKKLIENGNAIGASTAKIFPFLYADAKSMLMKPFLDVSSCTFFLLRNTTLYNKHIEQTTKNIIDLIDHFVSTTN